ncbi:MAG: Tim44/TimA family putative adaptor protein [Paracoccaceae bacterium]|jgi:predicted lipid-binding transport protein (Tim44 family)|nr:Tim44 domain-containing protein [Rhodobacterales bacterium]NCX85191.1 Tim44 domain-containing protein [Paracoccaceae bacterium]NDA28894.1 Tim44 domain-containing protein [Alphaproteobacteria bacterium]NCW05676.1 Tim44 domain-containing protein [Rhodobacterales bacterium]NCX27115.1 Tim44 domain-containing protein [Rhodobacterales bacterium]|tara:strand:+ start:2544 stop:3197 length:654 start_codon:yes stop_codon:yes gene_type:complete
MNPALIELIILAGIAVFLFLRLRSVLGTREGFEKPRMQPKNDAPKRDFKVIDGGEDKDITDNVDKNSKSAEALKLIKSEDENFTVNEFLSGARSAYEWILMSFEKNEIDEIRELLSEEVAEAFDAVVDQRVSQGLTIEAEFIGIREMKLVEATYSSNTKTAEISVSFVGEMTSVVKNSSGEIVEGDSKQIKRQKDTWTFSKDIKSSNPNWLLVATGE